MARWLYVIAWSQGSGALHWSFGQARDSVTDQRFAWFNHCANWPPSQKAQCLIRTESNPSYFIYVTDRLETVSVRTDFCEIFTRWTEKVNWKSVKIASGAPRATQAIHWLLTAKRKQCEDFIQKTNKDSLAIDEQCGAKTVDIEILPQFLWSQSWSKRCIIPAICPLFHGMTSRLSLPRRTAPPYQPSTHGYRTLGVITVSGVRGGPARSSPFLSHHLFCFESRLIGIVGSKETNDGPWRGYGNGFKNSRGGECMEEGHTRLFKCGVWEKCLHGFHIW